MGVYYESGQFLRLLNQEELNFFTHSQLEFMRLTADHSLFVQRSQRGTIAILACVNDIIVTWDDV